MLERASQAVEEADVILFVVDAAVLEQARDTVRAGDGYTVQAPGDVTLEAGQAVHLAPGFKAESGAKFQGRITEP